MKSLHRKIDRKSARDRRHARVRARVYGTAQMPRLCVFRSNRDISAQIVNDAEGRTLVSASGLSLGKDGVSLSGAKAERSRIIGKELAKRAGAKGIERVVFDRGGYRYIGRVKELAEGAREGGLQF